MATATLNFNMDDPADERLFQMMTQAKDLHLLLWSLIHEDLRGMFRYDDFPSDLNVEIRESMRIDYPDKADMHPSDMKGDDIAHMIICLINQRAREMAIDLDLVE